MESKARFFRGSHVLDFFGGEMFFVDMFFGSIDFWDTLPFEFGSDGGLSMIKL